MQITNLIYIKTCLILIFFIKAHTNLYHYINQLFYTKRHVCFNLSNEFHYVHQDSYTGKNYRISLTDSIKHKKENDMIK